MALSTFVMDYDVQEQIYRQTNKLLMCNFQR